MLALQFIRENKEVILKGLEKRNFKHPELIDAIIDLDQERRSQQATLDQQLARANQLAKEIGGLFKSGEIEKATVLKEETASLKTQTKTLQEKLQETSDSLFELRTQIPNIPHESVPSGTNEEDNEEIFKSGSIPKLDDKALPHWELASKYDLIDFELGSKITGAGFPVYKGKGAHHMWSGVRAELSGTFRHYPSCSVWIKIKWGRMACPVCRDPFRPWLHLLDRRPRRMAPSRE